MAKRYAPEYAFQPEFQAVLDALSGMLDIHVSFFAPTGEEVSVGEHRPICGYCALLQEKLGYARTCRALDRSKREEAAACRGMCSYRCHGGLHEAILPLFISGRLVGYVMIGQFRSAEEPPAAILRVWERGHARAELLQAYRRIPIYPAEKIRKILDLFDLLVRFSGKLRLVSLRNRSPLEPILFHMAERLEEHPTLRGVAAFAHRSPHTLSHQFKRILGKSFKTVQAEMLVDKAKEYFQFVPGATVGEVAARLGLQDARYFARLFRKQTGITPTQFRKIATKKAGGQRDSLV
jgi:AraC-like DNA-binding protein